MRGFSLIEMMIVVVIIMIVSGMTFMSVQPALRNARVTNAYNTTLTTLRKARESAVSTRWRRTVSFNTGVTPNTITVTDTNTGVLITTATLPNDISFQVLAGVPVTPVGACPTPDGWGTASAAVDFDQNVAAPIKTQIIFYPDGSAKDANLNISNGVVYLARSGDLYSSRAITLWGLTGRVRGWRLYSTGPGNCWSQQ